MSKATAKKVDEVEEMRQTLIRVVQKAAKDVNDVVNATDDAQQRCRRLSAVPGALQLAAIPEDPTVKVAASK